MIIDCISDLHGHYPKLEGGDILIVAGDLTDNDEFEQYCHFFGWLEDQQYKKKIFISGNHDNQAMSQFDWGKDTEYLYDSGTEFEGLKIWGSPWTKTFVGMNPRCKAFTVDTDQELHSKFSLIPDNIDILITHSPPHGIFDVVKPYSLCGSVYLREHVMGRIKPKIHVFGHIHEHGGKILDAITTKFINASHMDECYDPVNKPVRIIL